MELKHKKATFQAAAPAIAQEEKCTSLLKSRCLSAESLWLSAGARLSRETRCGQAPSLPATESALLQASHAKKTGKHMESHGVGRETHMAELGERWGGERSREGGRKNGSFLLAEKERHDHRDGRIRKARLDQAERPNESCTLVPTVKERPIRRLSRYRNYSELFRTIHTPSEPGINVPSLRDFF